MKMFLISDNRDTYTGMRLAGVEGVVAHERQEVEEAVRRALSDVTAFTSSIIPVSCGGVI